MDCRVVTLGEVDYTVMKLHFHTSDFNTFIHGVIIV